MQLLIFVPRPGTFPAKQILRGSGIVGTVSEPGRALIDFEGNRFNTEYLRRWDDRLLHAAGRHVKNYPTIARMSVALDDLIKVGEYDYASGSVYLHDDDPEAQIALADWLGDEVPCTPGLELRP